MSRIKKAIAMLISGVILSASAVTGVGAVSKSIDERISLPNTEGAEYIEGEAVVCMKTPAAVSSRRSIRSAGNSLKADIPDFECEELMTIDGGQKKIKSSKSVGLSSPRSESAQTDEKKLMLVRSDSMNTQTLIDTLDDNPYVEFAEPNYIYKTSSVASDEPYYGNQWYLNNDGSHSYTTEGDVNVNPIYENVTTGSDDVVVAVIDSGVDYTHEDLADRMWDQGLNYPELTALGGGMYGCCTVSDESYEYDSDDPYDDNRHGTHCAGIIAASWNGKGIAGITNNVKIMALKAGNRDCMLLCSDIIKAFNYIKTALDCGVNVKVINNSYGGGYYGSAINYAIEQCGEKGALSVFGAGNSGTNLDVCDLDHLNSRYAVRIAASNSSGKLASFSDYGSQKVDTAAPGVFILSSVPEDLGTYIPELMPAGVTQSLNDFDGSSSVHISAQDSSARLAEAEKGYSSKGLSVSLQAFNLSDSSESDNENMFENSPGILNVSFDNVPRSLSDTYFAAKIFGKDVQSYAAILYYDKEYGDWTVSNELMYYVHNDSWSYVSTKIPTTADIKKYGIKLLFVSETEESEQHSYIIDDVALGKGDTIPYAYQDGTSMACPAAVGVAALLASAGVDDPMELKARIIGGVQRSDEFSDLVVSQGILDAEKAYYNPEAVVNSISQQDGKIVIDGYFFGNDNGSATMTDVPLEIEQWSDNRIVCEAPENAASGNYEFRVTAADGRTGRKFLMYDGNDSEWKDLSADNIGLNDAEYENYRAEFCELNGDLYAVMEYQCDAEQPVYELYKYSVAGDSWTKLLTLDDDTETISAFCEIDGRIYMLLENDETTRLVYYDVSGNSLVSVNDDVQYGGAICGTDYNGKILAVDGWIYDDGEDSDFTDDENSDFTDDEDIPCVAYEIDPLDGSVKESEIESPAYLDSAGIKTVGDKIIFYSVPSMYPESDYSSIYYYDGKEWTQLPLIENLADTIYKGFDFSITENGVIMAGHVLQPDGNYVDVLEYDAEKGGWEINNNIYSTNDVFFLGGFVYNGRYYVLSKDVGTTGNYEFKSLALENKAEYIMGDVNMDGDVDITDVTAVQESVVEKTILSEEQRALADMNGDGEIDVKDATEIQMYIVQH